MRLTPPRLYVAAFAVLIVGVASGLAIYITAEAPDTAVDPILASKQYTRELLRFGGKMNVLFADLDRALDSLWHGPRLGATIALLSIAVSALLFLVAWHLSAHGDDAKHPHPDSAPREPLGD